jgi:hypothetical protein
MRTGVPKLKACSGSIRADGNPEAAGGCPKARVTVGYKRLQPDFNLLQAHCKDLKCVDLTHTPGGFVFEIAVSQSNILVRRRSAVRSCPWALTDTHFVMCSKHVVRVFDQISNALL